MINLAGVAEADKTILEELYLAGVPATKVGKSEGEVPYTYVGNIGNWSFRRAWYYWVVSVEKTQDGLQLKDALTLHNKKHPFINVNLGESIRSGGHCGCPSPDEYGAKFVYDDEAIKTEVDRRLKEGEPFNEELNKFVESKKLGEERFVDVYHIDNQVGLNEFVSFIKNLKNEN